MSFTDGFYTISVSLTDVVQQRYEQFRIRAVKHPFETSEYLAARMLAFVHCYAAGVEFSQGLFEPKQPAIWKRDVLGEVVLWAEVGVPDKKKLLHEIRTHPEARHAIYFYQPDQAAQFCHSCLRGGINDWATAVEFYELGADFAPEAAGVLSTRSDWEVTIVDSAVYLVLNGTNFQTTIVSVNIWEEYQKAIVDNVS